MKGPVQWMAKNHVAANLLMIILIVGGLIRASSVKQEVFPEISLDTVQVSVAYPGAGPEEVEEGILLQIEENLTGVEGIKQIKSVAKEGIGVVSAELYPGEDPDVKLQEIKSEVDRIITFPEDAEKPVITKLLNRYEVVSVVVYGDASDRALREQAEQSREELLSYPEMTQVDLSGVRPYEISIEVPEENLRRYSLTLDQVAQRVRQASLDEGVVITARHLLEAERLLEVAGAHVADRGVQDADVDVFEVGVLPGEIVVRLELDVAVDHAFHEEPRPAELASVLDRGTDRGDQRRIGVHECPVRLDAPPELELEAAVGRGQLEALAPLERPVLGRRARPGIQRHENEQRRGGRARDAARVPESPADHDLSSSKARWRDRVTHPRPMHDGRVTKSTGPCRAGGGPDQAIGSLTWKVVPSPSTLSTRIEPPIA